MKKNNVMKTCITAVFIALTYIMTAFIQIPIPLGYANLGDSMILLACFMFGPWVGCIAGGAGASLADVLTGYPIWAPSTIIIKVIIALIACVIFSLRKDGVKLYSVQTFIGSIVSMLFMAFGYTVAGAILYGSIASGLASTPGLLAEGVINIIVFYGIMSVLEKAGIRKLTDSI